MSLFFGACIYFRNRFTSRFFLDVIVEMTGIIIVMSLFVAAGTSYGKMSANGDGGLWRGLFGHKNSLGEFAALGLIILGAGKSIGIFRHWRYMIYIAASGICLFMSRSATAIGVLFFAFLVLLATRVFTKMRFKNPWLSVNMYRIVVLGGIALACMIIPLVTFLLGKDLTFTGRTGIWQWFLFFGNQRPWTGWGWATIGTNTYMLGFIRKTLGLPDIQTPHSGYISIIVEIGYPALAMFIAWLVKSFLVSGARAVKMGSVPETIRISVLAGLVLHTFFEATTGFNASMWTLILLSIRSSRSQQMLKVKGSSMEVGGAKGADLKHREKA